MQGFKPEKQKAEHLGGLYLELNSALEISFVIIFCYQNLYSNEISHRLYSVHSYVGR